MNLIEYSSNQAQKINRKASSINSFKEIDKKNNNENNQDFYRRKNNKKPLEKKLSLEPNNPKTSKIFPKLKNIQTISLYNLPKIYFLSSTFQDSELISSRFSFKKPSFLEETPLKYSIGLSNNGEIIKKVMETRKGWISVPSTCSTFNFGWQSNSNSFKYEKLKMNGYYKQIVNHFEFHKEISSKARLLQNMEEYTKKNKINLFEIIPYTFYIDFNNLDCEQEIVKFLSFFLELNTLFNHGSQVLNIQNILQEILKKKLNLNTINFIKKFTDSNFGKALNKDFKYLNSQFRGKNLWLIKPAEFNRGRGIRLFHDITSFFSILKEKLTEKEEGITKKNLLEANYIIPSFQEEIKKSIASFIVANNKKAFRRFVLQKYIESPLLINGRKFDIRVWVLVSNEMNVYLFREGYIRTSSELFDLSESRFDNQYIHLTNNAIQKNSKKYGNFESGNQLSYLAFEKYIQEKKLNLNLKDNIFKKIKEYTMISMNSVKNKLNSNERSYSFEIFGYDFIIDSSFHLWLIEVNTNPCLEESSPLLQMLIPRMIDDAFSICIDPLFKKKNNLINNEEIKCSKFKVDEYPDHENLWEKIGDISISNHHN